MQEQRLIISGTELQMLLEVFGSNCGANLSTNFGTALLQSTSFKRRATSTYNGKVCFSETDPVVITVLDQVNTGFILANRSICKAMTHLL